MPLRPLRLVALALALFGLVSSAQGGVIYVAKGGANGTNLLFQEGGITTDTGTLVNGVTNNPKLSFIDITTTANTNLKTQGGGAARVEASNGSPFGAGGITFQANPQSPGGGYSPLNAFLEMIFNLNASANGTVQFEAFNGATSLGLSQIFALGAGGSNFFTIGATGADVLTRIDIYASGSIVQDIRQIRIDGLNPATATSTATGTATSTATTGIASATATGGNVIPEPASLALWGALGAGLALAARRKKKPE